MAKPRIMVVEDDRIIADHIEITLNNLGYGVTAMVGSGG
jgi:CheY-like chemotaxis protein